MSVLGDNFVGYAAFDTVADANRAAHILADLVPPRVTPACRFARIIARKIIPQICDSAIRAALNPHAP